MSARRRSTARATATAVENLAATPTAQTLPPGMENYGAIETRALIQWIARHLAWGSTRFSVQISSFDAALAEWSSEDDDFDVLAVASFVENFAITAAPLERLFLEAHHSGTGKHAERARAQSRREVRNGARPAPLRDDAAGWSATYDLLQEAYRDWSATACRWRTMFDDQRKRIDKQDAIIREQDAALDAARHANTALADTNADLASATATLASANAALASSIETTRTAVAWVLGVRRARPKEN